MLASSVAGRPVTGLMQTGSGIPTTRSPIHVSITPRNGLPKWRQDATRPRPGNSGSRLWPTLSRARDNGIFRSRSAVAVLVLGFLCPLSRARDNDSSTWTDARHRGHAAAVRLRVHRRLHHPEHDLHHRLVPARRLDAAVPVERVVLAQARRAGRCGRPVGLRQLPGVGHQLLPRPPAELAVSCGSLAARPELLGVEHPLAAGVEQRPAPAVVTAVCRSRTSGRPTVEPVPARYYSSLRAADVENYTHAVQHRHRMRLNEVWFGR